MIMIIENELDQMLGEGVRGGGFRATGNTPGYGPAYIHTNTVHTQPHNIS